MVPKSIREWQPCWHLRVVNRVTIPYWYWNFHLQDITVRLQSLQPPRSSLSEPTRNGGGHTFWTLRVHMGAFRAQKCGPNLPEVCAQGHTRLRECVCIPVRYPSCKLLGRAICNSSVYHFYLPHEAWPNDKCFKMWAWGISFRPQVRRCCRIRSEKPIASILSAITTDCLLGYLLSVFHSQMRGNQYSLRRPVTGNQT